MMLSLHQTLYGLPIVYYIPGWVVMALCLLSCGWILRRAVLCDVYTISRWKALDASLLVWLIILVAVVLSPILLYLAFGFNEFKDSPQGRSLRASLQWTARLSLLLLSLDALLLWWLASHH